MNSTIYTYQHWVLDGTFKAKPLQEIESSIYQYFLECLPPYYAPKETVQTLLELQGVTNKVVGAFQNSEPSHHTMVLGVCKPCFATFAELEITNPKEYRYIYLGTMPRIK